MVCFPPHTPRGAGHPVQPRPLPLINTQTDLSTSPKDQPSLILPPATPTTPRELTELRNSPRGWRKDNSCSRSSSSRTRMERSSSCILIATSLRAVCCRADVVQVGHPSCSRLSVSYLVRHSQASGSRYQCCFPYSKPICAIADETIQQCSCSC